ncbi:ArsR/SmtB family transcription factor [Desulfovibrio ferrophilus]|uniref:Regulatory protein ArsR n=1 Tax=Desulfovibrio ferrophilus TaxID=241368 RepID=A0A2Z6B3A1_9BACT|nr:metalloregulator ArsR/SmtB family transcription factor [Desulfovibrio ferrophilus]BBD09890.1 regulatory protein ArsR [Desulfovibrio ferrophilus]
METLGLIFKAFADETRLRIINLLGEGELCVCDLMNVLEMPQSKVSRHLAYLRKAGWIHGHRCGKWMHYALSRELTPFQAKVLDSLTLLLKSHPQAVNDVAVLQTYLETKDGRQCGQAGTDSEE